MKTLNTPKKLLLLTLLLCFSTACGLKKMASKTTADIFYDATPSIDREEDVEMAEQASLGFLKMLEGFYVQNPRDKVVLLLLTRSYAGYAFGFTENEILATKGRDKVAYEKAMARAKRFYTRAQRFGLELLSLNSRFNKAKDGTLDEFNAALQTFKKKDVENLFWVGFAWGNYLNFNKDDVAAITQLPKAEAIMYRVIELDEDYYYGGADLFLGAFFGSRPKLLGGNPIKSKEHFEKAIRISDGKNLMAPVTMAQFYAVQVQDLALYKKLLQGVVSGDASALPDQRLLNELAKIRAQILLKNKSRYFTKASS